METGLISPNEVPLFKLQGVPRKFMLKYNWEQLSSVEKTVRWSLLLGAVGASGVVLLTVGGAITLLVDLLLLAFFADFNSQEKITMARGPFPEQLLFEKRLTVISHSSRNGRSLVWSSTIERLEITRETVDKTRFQLVKIIFRKKLGQRRIPIVFGLIASQDLRSLYQWAQMRNIGINDGSAAGELTATEAAVNL